MKSHKIFAAVTAFLALTAVFSACSEIPAEDIAADDVTESVTENVEAADKTSETTTEAAEEDAAEFTEDIPKPASDPAENGYVQVSSDNEFIDFEFIENYQGTTDIGDLADKAVEFIMSTDEYAEAMSSFDIIDEEFGEPYIADGKIIPQFDTAYPNDYDGDGNTETFITVKMPMCVRDMYSILYRFFIFADSDGNMTLLDYNCNVHDTVFLNYGGFKQITFGGDGNAGAEEHTILYGVKNGNAEMLYDLRGSFAKEDCFLSAFGWQGVGNFMYYDTVAGEYIGIDGVTVPEDTIREMDTDNVFENYYSETGNACPDPFKLVGGKYYMAVMGAMDPGSVYVYEDGKFKLLSNSKVRTNNSDIKTVVDFDIDQAIANMKPVEN